MGDKPQKQTDRLSKEIINKYKHVKWLFYRKQWLEFLVKTSFVPRSGVEACVSIYLPNREDKIKEVTERTLAAININYISTIKKCDNEISEFIKNNSLPPLSEIVGTCGI